MVIKLVQIFCHLSELVTYTFPILITVTGLIFPCKPPLLGSIVYHFLDQDCRVWNYDIICFDVKKVAIALLEFLISKHGTVSGLHYAVYSLVNGIIYLILKFNQIVEIRASIMKFREVQVLENFLNGNIRSRLFPIAMGVIPVVQIFVGFVILKLSNVEEGKSLDWLKLGMFGMVYLEVLSFNLIAVSAGAKLYDGTQKWLQGQRSARIVGIEEIDFRRAKVMRKGWKSCRPLRLQFGNNYVDRLTPLVIQEFCAVQTMSLILLNKSS